MGIDREGVSRLTRAWEPNRRVQLDRVLFGEPTLLDVESARVSVEAAARNHQGHSLGDQWAAIAKEVKGK